MAGEQYYELLRFCSESLESMETTCYIYSNLLRFMHLVTVLRYREERHELEAGGYKWEK